MRAQAIAADLEGLSIAELMRGGSPNKTGHDAQKYDPTQPRVPAGHPDGGQWTRGAGDGDRTPHPL